MKISEYIASTIGRLPKGYVFTYSDFDTEANKKEAVIKALNRLVKSGKIAKLSKGKYYKPESNPFGNLQPNQRQVVKDLLEDGNKIIGYLTGYSICNKFGLSSQVGNIIQIGKNKIVQLALKYPPATKALIFKKLDNIWNKLKPIYNNEFKNLVYGVSPKDEVVMFTMKRIKE